MFEAKCGDRPDLFFPPDSDKREDLLDKQLRVLQAKAICDTCPAKQTCRAHAFEKREWYGIWGGLDMEEMRKAPRKGA